MGKSRRPSHDDGSRSLELRFLVFWSLGVKKEIRTKPGEADSINPLQFVT